MVKTNKKSILLFVLLLLCAFLAVVVLPTKTVAHADDSGDRYVLDTSNAPTDTLAFAPVIADNMLYQQNNPVPVWGFAPAQTAVTVSLQRQDGTGEAETKNVTADENGCFAADFAPRAASFTEYKLTATDGENTVTAQYILFGELYISCGQSNMALNVQYCSNADELRQTATNPYIRVFMSPEVAGSANLPYYPSVYWAGGTWARGDNFISIAGASAVSYNFAVDLFSKLNTGDTHVPVGFLNASKGATSIEAWLSRPSIDGKEPVRAYLAERNRLLTEEQYNKAGSNNYNQVSGLFNAKIAPLSKLYVKGILWYQGENNVGNETAGQYYRNALSLLMSDWSKWFNGGKEDIPLLFAQITPHNYKYEQEALAYMWEGMAQAYADNADRCAMATTYDIPLDWFNASFTYRSPIHPIVKKPVGERLADFAYNRLYGGNGEKSSPVFASATFAGNRATVTFDNAKTVKTADGAAVRGFALCGENRIFYPAQAEINVDGTVSVTSEWVRTPVAVTYAFSTMISYANLCSGEGYPVAPFRSDNVQSQYYHAKEWQYADTLQHFVSDGSGTAENIAGMRDTYTASASVTLSVTDNGQCGKALRLDYTLRGRETFWVSPVLRHGNIEEQFAAYDTFSFRVRNGQSRKLNVDSVTVTLSDGRSGKLLRCDGGCTSEEIAANSDYTPYRFSLTRIVTDNGTEDISDLRATIADIKVYFKDFLSGSIELDDLSLGNIADLVTEQTTPPTPPADKDPDGETPSQPKPKKKGCGGALTVNVCVSLSFATLALCLAAFVLHKQRKNNEV